MPWAGELVNNVVRANLDCMRLNPGVVRTDQFLSLVVLKPERPKPSTPTPTLRTGRSAYKWLQRKTAVCCSQASVKSVGLIAINTLSSNQHGGHGDDDGDSDDDE